MESYLFDCEKNLYGKNCTVEFRKFLRKEQRFSSYEALKEQIQKDIRMGEEYFRRDRTGSEQLPVFFCKRRNIDKRRIYKGEQRMAGIILGLMGGLGMFFCTA